MEKHYQRIVKDTDGRVEYSLQRQERQKDHPFYGGFYDKNLLVDAKFAIYRVASMTAAYCCRDSRYYRTAEAYDSILAGLEYIRRVQHENGLFDYITCNFFSAPDTAFCIKKLIPVYEYLREKAEKTSAEQEICARMEEIIQKAAYGLLEGGFHTPNHRWAIASMLAKTGVLFQDECLKKAADEYLKEGIDCNADGEFSEKSAGNYNRINNDAMITLSEALGDESYEQHAIRNLRMMLTYLEPDGSIFTANSTRFDKDLMIFPKDYYMEYLYLGKKYKLEEFLGMCNTIFDIIEHQQISSPDFLIWFMLYPEYRRLEWEKRYVPEDFVRHYEQSGIVRGRQGGFTYTVMRDKSDFLYVHNGTSRLIVKLAGSFCEHRAFKAETLCLQQEDSIAKNECVAELVEKRAARSVCLHQTMHGWYYLPFEEKPDTSDWWSMDNAKRPKKSGPDMQIDVTVTEVKDGLKVRLRTSGVKGAPWRVELAFSGIHTLEDGERRLLIDGSERLVSDAKVLQTYSSGGGVWRVEPGFARHRFIDGKEDSEGKIPGCATVYYTDYTEFDHTIYLYSVTKEVD